LEGVLLIFLAMHMRRAHMNGIECSVSENSPQCTLSIRFMQDKERPAGFLFVREWTVEEAQAFADNTVTNSGHLCTSACGGWKWFVTAT
jgi:hypothetical protein